MNKGYAYYMKEANKIAFNSFFKSFKNFCKFFVFSVINLLAQATIIFWPAINFAKIKMIRKVKEDGKVSLIDMFDGVEEPKRLWTGIVYYLIVFAILFIFLIPVIAIESFYQSLVSYNVNFDVNVYIALLCIGFVIYLIPTIIADIKLCPAYYLLEKGLKLNASMVMRKSIELTKKDGKGTYFALNLTYLFGIFIYAVLMILIPYLIIGDGLVLARSIIGLIVLFILLIAYIIFIPWFTMLFEIAKYSLITDLVSDVEDETIEKEEKDEVDYDAILDEFFKEEE